jgi:predicted RNase H-like nuclease (RuvC/YqgF family)
MARLDTANSVSSGRAPSTVSHKKQKTDNVDKEKQFNLQSEMVDNVAKMGKSIETVARASLTHQIEGLQQKKFDLEMEKLRSGGNTEMSTLIDRRVQELDSNITSLKAQLHESHTNNESPTNNDVYPRAIEFNTPRSN